MQETNENLKTSNKEDRKALIRGIIVIALIIAAIFGGRAIKDELNMQKECTYTGCHNHRSYRSNWCYQHKKFAEKYGVYY